MGGVKQYSDHRTWPFINSYQQYHIKDGPISVLAALKLPAWRYLPAGEGGQGHLQYVFFFDWFLSLPPTSASLFFSWENVLRSL